MRVGLNLAFLAPGEMGGLEVYSRELTVALAKRGDLELTLLLGRPAADDPNWKNLAHTVVLDLDPRRRADWVRGDQRDVPRAASSAGLDVVHSLASTAPVHGQFRRVVTVHDINYLVYPEAHFGLRSLGMRVLVPLAVRRSHRVITPSTSTRDDLVRRLRAKADAIDIVPEGLGQSPARGTTVAPELPEGRPMILTVSAKRPHKNLRRLLRALALIPPERRPLLVLPGYPTPHEQELKAEARSLGIEGDARFLGWVSADELEGLYAAAAAFVFPSLYEGFGLPILEAMARGVPVATSSRGSLGEVAGDAALLFDPDDERSIADAVERLLRDEELAASLRSAGLERAGQFSWEAAAEGTVQSYRRALDSPA
jgi:glycosyltransferase involved in cell wall biosynthesis